MSGTQKDIIEGTICVILEPEKGFESEPNNGLIWRWEDWCGRYRLD